MQLILKIPVASEFDYQWAWKGDMRELVLPASQMVNSNNPKPLSMEARVCKLEAQVVELGIKIGTQFHATEYLVKTLSVKISSFREGMFNFRDELLEAMELDRSAIMNPVQRSSAV
nr:hypothetical protein Iba_chr07fCG8970 [Ipomoea batatas]